MASRKPSISQRRAWTIRTLTALAASVVLQSGPPAGAEASASAPPPPLFVDCRGSPTAGPTVILVAGAFGTSSDWDRVLDDLAAGGRACAWDRSGTGRSPPRPGGQDVVSVAQEMWTLLGQIGETGAVILVGHSNGALYAETFAALWPERVAGLAYVNGVGSDALDHPALLRELARERELADLAVTVGDLGGAALVARTLMGDPALSAEAAGRKRAALTSLADLRTARDEDRAIIPGLRIPRETGGPPASIPVAVIVGAQYPDRAPARAWRVAEVAPARRARRSWVLDAVGASHVSPLARDRAWIGAAVGWLRSLPHPDVGH